MTAETGGGRVPGAARWWARLALLCAAASVAALVGVVGGGGLLVVAGGLAGLVAAAVGGWWVLAHRGPLRALGVLLLLAAPVTVVVLYTGHGLWGPAVLAIALWAAAIGSARSALRRARRPSRRTSAVPAQRPRRPVLLMNPASGGGKVARFHLAERAESLGARVVLLPTDGRADITALAHRAVADGADLLGVAGGDGTQALVAAVAADEDLPFLVITAGTRNHFAMDLGLDRQDPARCLDALTDGEEIRVDLGTVAGRPFVNTVSFGVYAEVVRDPRYRGAQAGTILDALPDLLLQEPGKRLDAYAGQVPLPGLQALLVSNNPYTTGDLLGAGRRARLDGGVLGAVGIRVDGAAQAAEVALRGTQATGLTVLTADRVRVTSTAPELPVAVDGEALTLPTPVICALRPRALRVLVPRNRPGVPPVRPRPRWRQIVRLASGGPA
ncbi:diacylglycerol kinase family protein [Streptomyces sp. NPDC000594]|uniref:diacylglycerol/lipid kinase family protein n=1 Tax=Streptomyces sp. NPDC000594 TaxID=3154261 RepID=UPI0033221B4D